ncbi:hypothetical protein B0T18DRAFT_323153 [Schizothecium vesticola]|uniref:Cytochrome c oxidase assembly protein COX20, mitochondrial n=1 Tax=Schizothecium vesticola TaxID=314040 RepID=A0AA40F2S0_9PEZI|nr:hypothetical protein B0T18DRAFT_323153 [Schizothecium vesticola]
MPAPDSPSPPPSDGPKRTWAYARPPSPTPANPPTDATTTTPPPANPEFKSNPSLTDAVTTIKPNDFLSVHQTPCAQRGFLTGISAGMGIGGLRWVLGLSLPRAANWAVGAGVAAAAAQYEWCQFRRRVEREKMVRMVKVYNARQAAEKEKAEGGSRGEEGRDKKGEVGGSPEAGKGGWKFW